VRGLNKEEVAIKWLSIENFLSFKKTTVEFGKLTVLVGPNASGKSNLIKALTLLSCIGKADRPIILHSLCKNCLGTEAIEQFFHDSNRNVRLKIDLRIENHDASYLISFDTRGLLTEEKMTFDGQNLLIRLSNGKVQYMTESGKIVKTSIADNEIGLLHVLPNAHSNLRKVKDCVGGIFTYSFESDSIRSSSPVSFNLSLKRDGSNLSQTLHTLLTAQRKRFIQIEEVMKKLIPEIEEINVPSTEDGKETFLSIREKEIDKSLTHQNISDGTLRILAFVTALYLKGVLIAFEEPENCVHPYLFETLVDLARKAPAQVVMTTHSPYLVSKVKNPEDLLLLTKEKGQTKIERVQDIDDVKKLLEEGFPLGEIWYMGQLQRD